MEGRKGGDEPNLSSKLKMESHQNHGHQYDSEVDPYVVAKHNVKRKNAAISILHHQGAPSGTSKTIVPELVREGEPKRQEDGDPVADGVQSQSDAAEGPRVVIDHASVDVDRHPYRPQDRGLGAVHGEGRLYLTEPRERAMPVDRLGEDDAEEVKSSRDEIHERDVDKDLTGFRSDPRDEGVGADDQPGSEHGQGAAKGDDDEHGGGYACGRIVAACLSRGTVVIGGGGNSCRAIEPAQQTRRDGG